MARHGSLPIVAPVKPYTELAEIYDRKQISAYAIAITPGMIPSGPAADRPELHVGTDPSPSSSLPWRACEHR